MLDPTELNGSGVLGVRPDGVDDPAGAATVRGLEKGADEEPGVNVWITRRGTADLSSFALARAIR